jgi:predicted DsbA family dithiol-disulfide isomerase
MRVDIWSDVVCPWCYVGKGRFEKALSTFAHADEVEIVYHSFELDPSAPRGTGETNLTMLAKKFGKSEAEALAMDDTSAAWPARRDSSSTRRARRATPSTCTGCCTSA